MNRWKINQVATIWAMLAMVFLGPMASTLSATRESRPFWTEKSSFIEGDELFVVGVASRARSVEEGRKQAFENGKIELMNFAQVTNLEARGLVIETQMTYEESNPDGSVTVYRLLKIPGKKLLEIQDRVHAESLVQEISIEKQIRELSDIQRGLEAKTQKAEQQQRDLESLFQNLERQLALSRGTPVQSGKIDSLTNRLETIETTLTAKERELAEISRRASARIFDETARNVKHCKLLVLGMTAAEVRAIMGENGKIYGSYASDETARFDQQKNRLNNPDMFLTGSWFYGSPVKINLYFYDGTLSRIDHDVPDGPIGGTRGCPRMAGAAP